MRGSKSTSTPLHPFVPFSSSAVVPLTFRQSRHLFLCIGAQKLLPLHFSHWLLCHWCSQTLVPPESLLFHHAGVLEAKLTQQLPLQTFSCSSAAGARRGCCAFAVHETAAGALILHGIGSPRTCRSEEHTSELQSR